MSWYGYFRIKYNAGLDDSLISKAQSVCIGEKTNELLQSRKSIDSKEAIIEAMTNGQPSKLAVDSLLEITTDEFELFENADDCNTYIKNNITNWQVEEEYE